MAQTMEAWLIADLAALKKYYGREFLESAIPRNQDVENIDKRTLESALDTATRRTQKGSYHKIRHGAELLRLINQDVVCGKAMHCKRLLQMLESLM